MADERVRHAVKITDPTTDANEAAVTAAGELQTIDANLATEAALSDSFANPTTTQVGSMLMGFDRVGGDWTRIAGVVDGEVVGALNAGFLMLGTDGSNYQVVSTDAAGQLQVDVITTVGPDQEADDDSVVFAQSQQRVLNLMYASNGTTWERVTTDGAGSLDVNVTLPLPVGTNEIGDIGSINTNVVPGVAATSLGKARAAVGGLTDTGVAVYGLRDDAPSYDGSEIDGDYVNFRFDASGRLHVADPNAGAGTPTNPTIDRPALATVAAGAVSTGTELRTADLGGTTQQLSGVDISSSAPFKFDLISEIDDAETIRTTGFGQAGKVVQWRPPNKAYYLQVFAANAGFDGWRVEATNLDNSQAADFYATFYRED